MQSSKFKSGSGANKDVVFAVDEIVLVHHTRSSVCATPTNQPRPSPAAPSWDERLHPRDASTPLTLVSHTKVPTAHSSPQTTDDPPRSLPPPTPPSPNATRQAGAIYEARILDVNGAEEGAPMYKVHFKGWNKNWEQWMEPKRILKNTREHRLLQGKAKAEAGVKGLTLVQFTAQRKHFLWNVEYFRYQERLRLS